MGVGAVGRGGCALAEPRRWPLGDSICRREQVFEVGASWEVGS